MSIARKKYYYLSLILIVTIITVRLLSVYAAEVNLVQNGSFDSDLSRWSTSKNPATSAGAVTIETNNCQSGKCIKLSKANSDSLLVFQNVGSLISGQRYKLTGLFKTTPAHYGYIAIQNNNWNQSCSKPKNKIFIQKIQGTNTWKALSLNIGIPAKDDCGASTATHTWRVILRGDVPNDSTEVFYDTIELSMDTNTPPKLISNIEEQQNWFATCQVYTNAYPLTSCHSDFISYENVDKVSGSSSLILKGTREKQEKHSVDIPVKPNTLYKISFSLKIKDRLTFSYLDLQYPLSLTQDRPGLNDPIKRTKGIWKGVYSVTVNSDNILNKQWTNDYSIAATNLDWFNEFSYFTTRSDQYSALIEISLEGFDGKLYIDEITLEESESFIDDSFLHIPIETSYGDMKIKNIGASPLTIQTNASEFSFTDSTLFAKKESNTVGTITFPTGFLAGLSPQAESGAVYLENQNLKMSIGADSLMLVKLKKSAVIKVTGPKPLYHSFEAGVIFSTNYEHGIFFGPVRTPEDVATMPYSSDPQNQEITYSDSEFEKLGLKTWNLLSDFTQSEWKVEYNFKAGEGFMSEVFPPKNKDEAKRCEERAAAMSGSIVQEAGADYSYRLQNLSTRFSVGIVFAVDYLKAVNPINPPVEYCTDAQEKIISCSSPQANKRFPVPLRGDIGGPYESANIDTLKNMINKAHNNNMKIILYVTPGLYYTTNTDIFLNNVKQLMEQTGADGIYVDGLTPANSLRSLAFVRKARNVLKDKFYLQHLSNERQVIYASTHMRVPYEDVYADMIWNGESVKYADDGIMRINYCNNNVSNTNSVTLPELRPVDYTKSSAESFALSLSPETQIDRLLACGGQLRVSNNIFSNISDKHFETQIPFRTSYAIDKLDNSCISTTCGNGRCTVGESIFTCPVDCAPTSSSVVLNKENSKYICSSSSSVAQWTVDQKPLYDMHMTFDDTIVSDVSGRKMQPANGNDLANYPSRPNNIDGRLAHIFVPQTEIRGDYRGSVMTYGDTFSSALTFKKGASGTATQNLFRLQSDILIQYGIKNNKPFVRVRNVNGLEEEYLVNITMDGTNWHTIGITYNKPKLIIYLDGIPKSEVDVALKVADPNRVVTYSIGSGFDGYIDDLFLSDEFFDQQKMQEYQQTGMKSLASDKFATCFINTGTTQFFSPTTNIISPTPSNPPVCQSKSQGDSNCNGIIDMVDFEIFRSEYFAGCSIENISTCDPDEDNDSSLMDSNFNHPGSTYPYNDQIVDLTDFEIWRKSRFN